MQQTRILLKQIARTRQRQPTTTNQAQTSPEYQTSPIPEFKSKTLGLVVSGYLATVNALSYALFGYDKQQAKSGGWRVPERTLWLTALFGGWIGGMIAMEHFHHKTKKTEFRTPYFLATGLNAAALGVAGRRALKDPRGFQKLLQEMLKQQPQRR